MPFSLPGGSGGGGGGGGGGGTAPTTLYAPTDAAGLEVDNANAALTVTADPDGFEVLVLDFQPTTTEAPRQLVSALRNGTAWPTSETADIGFVISENASNSAEILVWSTGATNLTIQGTGNDNWSGNNVIYRIFGVYGYRSVSDYLRYGQGPKGDKGDPGDDATGAGVTLSDLPALPPADIASAGTADEVSRRDHLHPKQTSILSLEQHGVGVGLADAGNVINTGTDLRRVAIRHATPPTIVWQAYSLLADVSTLWGESSGTYRWRGRHPSGSSVSSVAVGDVICTASGNFESYVSSVGTGTGWFHLRQPDDFLGVFLEGTTEANPQVTAVGQTAQYGEGLHSVTSYTAGTTARAVLHRAIPRASVLDLSDTPSSFGSNGEVLAVNAAGDALEFVAAGSGGGGVQSGAHPIEIAHEHLTSFALTGNPHSEQFNDGTIHWNNVVFAEPVAKADVFAVSSIFGLQTRFDAPIWLDRGMIEHVGYANPTTWTWTGQTTRIPCAYLSLETGSGSEDRDPLLLRPSFFQANARRQASRESFLVFLLDNGGNTFTGLRTYYSGSVDAYWRRVTVYKFAGN